ncbi:MAG: 2-C-methyl-D-erythritol 4-phosphate cytidylyltransferase [Lachnospiraceae bacterium]|nr:2-C-methyl-D-erythritol 4-phosphate cytidylyltransferase [Lachnospiraceae bacterium]
MQEIISAVIVAAGTGKRMNSPVKKQYIEIAGYPVLYYTLKAFEESNTDELIVVTGEDEIPYVREKIIEKYNFKKVVAICKGGRERCDSVYEGLKQILSRQDCDQVSDGYVLIHDGVRPLITPEFINSCIENVKLYEACIPGVPEKDTVKEADCDMKVSGTPDRKKLFRIQTPQCFKLSLIREAFEKYYGEKNRLQDVSDITDDAMLVERYTGYKIKITEGDYRNIKITTPEDTGLAEYFLKGRVMSNAIQ